MIRSHFGSSSGCVGRASFSRAALLNGFLGVAGAGLRQPQRRPTHHHDRRVLVASPCSPPAAVCSRPHRFDAGARSAESAPRRRRAIQRYGARRTKEGAERWPITRRQRLTRSQTAILDLQQLLRRSQLGLQDSMPNVSQRRKLKGYQGSAGGAQGCHSTFSQGRSATCSWRRLEQWAAAKQTG